MNVISEDMQKDLLLIIRLQRQIQRINEDSRNYETIIQNLLRRSGEFVNKYNPTEYTIATDEQGKPRVSFSWTTSAAQSSPKLTR